jgi:hypothetical protein
MNQALQITCPVSSDIPFGRIPFLRYDPQDTSKPQPLLFYLHGAGSRSLTQTTTTVRHIEQSSEGVLYYTNSAHPTTGGIFPSITDDITGEVFEFYMLAPQLYGDPSTNSGSLARTWTNTHITRLVDYAKDPANGMNIDWTRFYLTGYSLGAGGTMTALAFDNINTLLAAAGGTSPGYFAGNGSDGLGYQRIARSGVPIFWCHAAGDTTASISISDSMIRNIRQRRPLVDPIYHRWQTGSHGVQFRLYDLTEGDLYPQTLGTGSGQTVIAEQHLNKPGFFKWLLRHKRTDNNLPYYPEL